MKNKEQHVNLSILFVLSIVWGSSYILMKKGLLSFSAMQVAMLRIIFAGIVLLPYFYKAIKQTRKKDIKYILLVAFLGSGLPTYLYPLAITKIDSSMAGIINSLTPLFTLLFGLLFFERKSNKMQSVGLIIAFFGAMALVLNIDGETAETSLFNKYLLLAILATVCYGFSSNILKTKLSQMNAIAFTSFSFVVLLPFASIILWQSDVVSVIQTNDHAKQAMFYILILGVLGTAAALVLFNRLIQRTDAVYATSVTYFIPIVALMWGVLDGEKIGLKQGIGVLLIIIGVYITNVKSAKSSDNV